MNNGEQMKFGALNNTMTASGNDNLLRPVSFAMTRRCILSLTESRELSELTASHCFWDPPNPGGVGEI